MHLERSAWLPNRTRAPEGRRILEETPAKERALAALNALGEERAVPEVNGPTDPGRSDEPRIGIPRGSMDRIDRFLY